MCRSAGAVIRRGPTPPNTLIGASRTLRRLAWLSRCADVRFDGAGMIIVQDSRLGEVVVSRRAKCREGQVEPGRLRPVALRPELQMINGSGCRREGPWPVRVGVGSADAERCQLVNGRPGVECYRSLPGRRNHGRRRRHHHAAIGRRRPGPPKRAGDRGIGQRLARFDRGIQEPRTDGMVGAVKVDALGEEVIGRRGCERGGKGKFGSGAKHSRELELVNLSRISPHPDGSGCGQRFQVGQHRTAIRHQPRLPKVRLRAHRENAQLRWRKGPPQRLCAHVGVRAQRLIRFTCRALQIPGN